MCVIICYQLSFFLCHVTLATEHDKSIIQRTEKMLFCLLPSDEEEEEEQDDVKTEHIMMKKRAW
jgi:hypothetical protein